MNTKGCSHDTTTLKHNTNTVNNNNKKTLCRTLDITNAIYAFDGTSVIFNIT